MNTDELQDFIALRDRVAALQAVKCHLFHEKVTAVTASHLPLALDLTEFNYQRVGLCNRELRNQRLACGHTMARYTLQNALTALMSYDIQPHETYTALWNELNTVTTAIHTLDHQKGDAEKDHARLLLEHSQQASKENVCAETSTSALKIVAQQIKEIAHKHDNCVDEISLLRESIVAHMNRIIDYEADRLACPQQL